MEEFDLIGCWDMRCQLIIAIQKNDAEAVKNLISVEQINPNFSLQMINPICYAASKGNIQILNLLLDAGADPHTPNQRDCDYFWERQPIHIAASKGHLETIQLLVQRGVDINQQDSDQRTPLHWVSMYGQDHLVKWMVKAGASVNASQADSFTPLHVATCLNHITVCRRLIEEGANILLLDNAGWTPLHTAVCFGYSDLVQLYLDQGANPCDCTVCPLQENTLHIACSKGNVHILKLLLKNGASLEGVNGCGETPLHTAVTHNHSDAVCYLIKTGANVNANDFSGRSPVDKAAARWAKDTIKILLKAGGRVTVKTPFICGRKLPMETHPQSLKQLCFLCIRQTLSPHLQENARYLPLPQFLKGALMMEDLQLNISNSVCGVNLAKDNIEDYFSLLNFHDS
ncbi:hypothetical protein Btru_076788 [Bulinus truncatus]|nr:hypothetical protein Btru_076788 [Bulinus truncatus]